MSNITTRFPPSPTGYLHIGGARTALFNWLYAKNNNGKFLLRIEDTDLARSTPEATKAIFDAMRWLGITPDSKPVFQSERISRHKEVIKNLLNEKKAYKCYCAKERLDNLREMQINAKQKPKYDGKCRNLQQEHDAPYVIRFKNPIQGSVSWNDAVKNVITINNSELDDLIIQRTDGSPTYNLCVVVDDIDMGITDIIRGDDHINNTPRQINLYHALKYTVPNYAHIPMILGEDGKKTIKKNRIC